MTATPRSVDLGFSVADAEYPHFELDQQTLTLHFRDWTERTVVAVFDNTIAVRWQEAEHYFGPDDRYDSCFEIVDSPWLAEHERQHATYGGLDFRHLKLNFNAAGILEVLCTTVSWVAE
jgi:hypothetical protein